MATPSCQGRPPHHGRDRRADSGHPMRSILPDPSRDPPHEHGAGRAGTVRTVPPRHEARRNARYCREQQAADADGC